MFESEKIKISAIYSVHSYKNTIKVVDFTQLFMDFKCFAPVKHCLLISNHNICDVNEVEQQEIIGTRIGIGYKMNSEKVSVASSQYYPFPIHILLPNPNLNHSCTVLKRIAKALVSHLNEHFYMKNDFDFEHFLKASKYKIFESDVPQKALKKYLEIHSKKFNSKDQSLSKSFGAAFSNYFIV